MRTLKFRAWNEKWKSMEYIEDLYWFEESGVHEVVDGVADSSTGVYNIMQFTGLYDRNGKEIYEGDIVRFKDYSGGAYAFGKQPMAVGEVYWDKRRSGWKAKGHKVSWFEGEKYEVIGNIYEGYAHES